MAVNAVAPWEGELIWKGEVNEYNKWKSIDFTLKYTNSQMEEEYMTFNAFGKDKVNQILSYPEGTMLKVVWWPKSNASKSGDRWFTRNNVLNVGLANSEAKSADTKIKAPSYTDQGTQLPSGYAPMPIQGPKASYPQPVPPMPQEDRSYTPNEEDLPF